MGANLARRVVEKAEAFVRFFVIVAWAERGHTLETEVTMFATASPSDLAPSSAAAARSFSAVPLVDIVAYAREAHPPPRTDLVSTVTVYGAAVLATAGFVIASVVDELLGMRRKRARAGKTIARPVRRPFRSPAIATR